MPSVGEGNDTEMFWRHQPGGPATIINKPDMGTGKFYWVDSNAGTQFSNSVGSDQAPCKTIAAAVVLATAHLALDSRNINHTILIKEGHTETLTAAIALITAGIKIIALGNLGQRAKLTMITNTTAAFVVTGANCKIQGIDFVCNVASLTEFIDVAADDLEICDNTLKEGTQVALSMITADTTDGVGDNLYIHHNYFTQPSSGAGTSAVEIAKDLRNVRIEFNRMYGDWDDACIEIPADGKDCTELQIQYNQLSNLLTGQHAIQINSTTCTGMIRYNDCQTDTQSATIDAGACSCYGNLWSDVDGSNDEEAVPVNANIASATSTSPGLGGIDDATTDSINGKLGTDTEMSDSSLFDMITAANVVAIQSGTRYVIQKDITSSTVPLDSSSGQDAPLTAAASGDLLLEEISFTVSAGTGMVGPTTFQVVSDNVAGLTGDTVSIWGEATASLGVGTHVSNSMADANFLPMPLESGKKLFINGDDGVGTGAGVVTVTMVFSAITAGATIAAA